MKNSPAASCTLNPNIYQGMLSTGRYLLAALSWALIEAMAITSQPTRFVVFGTSAAAAPPLLDAEEDPRSGFSTLIERATAVVSRVCTVASFFRGNVRDRYRSMHRGAPGCSAPEPAAVVAAVALQEAASPRRRRMLSLPSWGIGT
ncbi:uncharacterized protein BJX67DRAFT_384928 [Aspergillus lucknowensis]|uniref:Uncharacterized protein n=1 Tax=Aspergillus lucknowensis TaxID=176173 RepID=A0ABR4LF69_9EURO